MKKVKTQTRNRTHLQSNDFVQCSLDTHTAVYTNVDDIQEKQTVYEMITTAL